MSQSPSAARPQPVTPAELSLAALRSEIDAVDDAVLRLVQERQGLARRISRLKPDGAAGLRLRPDREAAVVARLLDRAGPEDRPLVLALWREILAAGLSAQGRVTVTIWSAGSQKVEQAARLRFGVSARYVSAAGPAEALHAAGEEGGMAVLALPRETPWWAELADRSDLWVFEAVPSARGREDPLALAVGTVPPETLARGVTYRVSVGGESGHGGRGERMIATGQGCRLYAAADGAKPPPLDRSRGVLGCAPLVG